MISFDETDIGKNDSCRQNNPSQKVDNLKELL